MGGIPSQEPLYLPLLPASSSRGYNGGGVGWGDLGPICPWPWRLRVLAVA